MKIRFHQSGGFAGLSQSCEIDTQTLTRAEALEIENLVKTTGVLKSKSMLSRIVGWHTRGAHDIFGYSISVESSEITYRVSFDDFTIPVECRSLLHYLKKRARPHPT